MKIYIQTKLLLRSGVVAREGMKREEEGEKEEKREERGGRREEEEEMTNSYTYRLVNTMDYGQLTNG